MHLGEIRTPALVVDVDIFEGNVAAMSRALPRDRLRPHVKAWKCTTLARMLFEAGHRGFCCATLREVEGMASAGLGEDLLLANQTLDTARLAAIAGSGTARLTVAVDSEDTIRVAAAAGVKEVLIDVNVGMPRCGCQPETAGKLADLARASGLDVRGVMGYEGHAVGNPDRGARQEQVDGAVSMLREAYDEVGGEVVSAGGTGTYDMHDWASEIQAGSFALMDAQYALLDLPFRPALFLLATVISVNPGGYAVCDGGLKSLGMDHGNPSMQNGEVWFCSDEHVTFAPSADHPVAVGDLVWLTPAHVDPTVARHERLVIARGPASAADGPRDRSRLGPDNPVACEEWEVLDAWDIDLRHW